MMSGALLCAKQFPQATSSIASRLMMPLSSRVSPQDSNVKAKTYRVIQEHTSEYPEPITFTKGAPLSVGQRYEGLEGWDDWFFCETPGQKGGWVPAQIIEIINGATGRARDDYTARELNTQLGDLLLGTRTLNGWVWCENPNSSESGWVPLANLKEAHP